MAVFFLLSGVLWLSHVAAVESALPRRPPLESCLCATGNVNARSGGSLSSTIITTLSPGVCAKFAGGHVNANGIPWYEIATGGSIGHTSYPGLWVSGNYLSQGDSSSCSLISSSSGTSTGNTSCPSIVDRNGWHARAPTFVSYLSQAVQYAFIHHSDTRECFSRDSCSSSVRGFQNYHMDDRKWGDIGYSFLIGGDGTVFEGRGWDRVGAHTRGYNSVGLGFCLIGNFTTKTPTKVQLDTVQKLIDCGVSMGKIIPAYIVKGQGIWEAQSVPEMRCTTLYKSGLITNRIFFHDVLFLSCFFSSSNVNTASCNATIKPTIAS